MRSLVVFAFLLFPSSPPIPAFPRWQGDAKIGEGDDGGWVAW
ncbi:MAG TPA: hypothetical protein VG738_23960 [Chitinophagaceae bacterium]|nr:hypothetical protein [Chitinophagaceae bacterium]